MMIRVTPETIFSIFEYTLKENDERKLREASVLTFHLVSHCTFPREITRFSRNYLAGIHLSIIIDQWTFDLETKEENND